MSDFGLEAEPVPDPGAVQFGGRGGDRCGVVVVAGAQQLPVTGAVPVLLLEIDRRTEDAHELVHKLRRYWEWGRLPAPDVDKYTADLVRSRPDAIASVDHEKRLWRRVYPPTGREGHPSFPQVTPSGGRGERGGADYRAAMPSAASGPPHTVVRMLESSPGVEIGKRPGQQVV
ncbi:hypothetical protein [Streptomyces sp. NPDC006368]|uniref:hypothetical protein n=1 Tax=Streptomyces sp. NPDC006368 TaxID=3156760 RepID=UPI0033A3FAB1